MIIKIKIINATTTISVGMFLRLLFSNQAYGVNVLTGEFGTDMLVNIANDGPVTIIYESQDGKIIWKNSILG